ncbi:inner membrane protein [Thermanaeromonas toyohensis ToBE]|uniref:Inner membrane protein n=1 Tax=Thermanaeromonas toyohensis ToBE TaxID=698762 RepID=A0A1W1VT68_9FIRM|nr:metal-dependent hydrolase [Thermanaeromonas toyohensis]SMB96463.1 inner membrane protein [Thermanaeromonas toyohensis ToBE]
MLYRTHFAAGLCTGFLIAAKTGGDVGPVVLASAVGALLPDIDQPRSYIGRKVPVSYGAYLVAGHRGLFHSLVGAVGIALLALVALQKWTPAHSFLWLSLAAGYLSHLALDTLNPSGVPWLWPLKLRASIPLVRTGSVWERLFVSLPLYLVVAFMAMPALKGTMLDLVRAGRNFAKVFQLRF